METLEATTAHNTPPTKKGRRNLLKGLTNMYVILPIILFVGVVAIGVIPRLERGTELKNIHEALATDIPQVNATTTKAADSRTTLLLPGDIQPIQNIPIYARANGYILKRFVDIGDEVKKGDLLAVIDTPELDHQLEQARADLRTAEANLTTALADRQNFAAQLFSAQATIKQSRTNLEFSNVEYKRYQDLAIQGAISYEQRDQTLKQFNSDVAAQQVAQENAKAALAQTVSADARIAASKQSVESSEQNVARIKALQGFNQVVAPSDGVITDRLVDAGALVAAGGAQGTTQLLSMARTDKLRIYVDVPQSDYRHIHNGDKADILLQEYPGKKFTGTVTNLAGSLNSNSRTLQTELQIQNQEHVLRPGSYADVRFVFNLPNPPQVVPNSAVVTRNDGLYAYVVKNGHVKFQPIEVARDYGNRVEVSQGLAPNSVVLLDPSDTLADGDQVRPLMVAKTPEKLTPEKQAPEKQK
jgi:RND family efflux transporter MFP subunit